MKLTAAGSQPDAGLAEISWEQVRHRLRASERARDAAMSEDPAITEIAYRKRAARLAKSDERSVAPNGLSAMVFSLGRERYAIEMKDLKEVLPSTRCTPVPGAAAHFQGVINLRGELRAVLDLRAIVLHSQTERNDSGFVLLLHRPGQEIGFQVDQIEGVTEILRQTSVQSGLGRYVKGTTREAVMLLDLDAVLADIS